MVHSNLCRPLAIPNQGHHKNYVIFIDNYNRMTWLYLMKERSEAFTKLLSFVNEINNQHSETVKVFHSDNA